MRTKTKSLFPYTPTKANYNFEEVDIFLRVKGRLPVKKGDGLTQEILNEYCQKFEEGKLILGIVPLEHMYNLIKNNKIRVSKKDCEVQNEN